MNGAENLTYSLVQSGVNVCFANPGTSEMHLVAAVDRIGSMRCVLGLFEGVVTGAADGYARMSGRPAATLMHLGPGLANGIANLHNARKSLSPVVNIVGDHATFHRQFETPLSSDLEGMARIVSHWTRTCSDVRLLSSDAAAAVAIARSYPGQIATLIVPADTAWNAAPDWLAPVGRIQGPRKVSRDAIFAAAAALKTRDRTLMILGAGALRAEASAMAQSIAKRAGAKLMAEPLNARVERGSGRVPVDCLSTSINTAAASLNDFDNVILIGAALPVALFAYPDKRSILTSDKSRIFVLARPDEDITEALGWLAEEVGATGDVAVGIGKAEMHVATGTISPEALGQSLGVLLPANAIVVDEAITVGRSLLHPTKASAPHDWLQNAGGAIGLGLPQAIGAAIACPDRRVIALQGDGSAMYTPQALWTQAREGLDITNVIFANRTYAVLNAVLANIGIEEIGPKARNLIEIGRPDINWAMLANAMGVPAKTVRIMDEFNSAFRESVSTPGPSLIEVVL